MMLTSCSYLGYVKIELHNPKPTDIQACQFDESFTEAKCVNMEDFLQEFNKAADGDAKALSQFEKEWAQGQCAQTSEGTWVCRETVGAH